MTERPDNAITPRPNEAVTVARSGLVSRGLALADSVPAHVAQYAGPTEKARLAGVDFDWVIIPAGEFLMGSDNERRAPRNELPQQRVYLATFRIARVPVTNAQYEKFVAAAGHDAPEHWEHGRIPPGKENHPVVNVSWYDAQAFCKWAGVRLPTEAEWEKAARGTDGRIYPWGDDGPTKDRCNFCGDVGDTTPVGSYPRGASPYGVLDMAGNVWEWTSSLYKPYPYDADDEREDSEGYEHRTLRGGSWRLDAFDNPFGLAIAKDDARGYVRCARRFRYNPGHWVGNLGFRFVSPGFGG